MVAQVRPRELKAWLAQQTGPAVVLDVREPVELRTAAIRPDGFELVTIPMNEVPARIAELDSGRPVACLCHHGARSQSVALFLAHNGFQNVVNIAGGIDAWSTECDAGVPRY